MDNEIEKLEAVFYSGPIPSNLSTLTFLGLVFDRVHFPNVYIPSDDFDPDEVLAEISRLQGLNLKDHSTWLLVELLKYALKPELRSFCHFTGQRSRIFDRNNADAENSRQLVNALYEQIYGPPPVGFVPTFIPGYNKGISKTESIDYPGPLFYQSNAIIYAGKHGIPLLNDNPNLPVPAIDLDGGKNNVKLLSAILAMECVKFALPEMGQLQPEQLMEAREDLSPYLRPFRLGMLKLANKLNAQIDSESDHNDIIEAATFLIQTDVYPALAELKNELGKPSKGWIDRSWDATKKVPLLIAACAVFDVKATIPAILILLGDWLKDSFSKEKPRSDLYYLLKLQDRFK